MKNNIFSIFNNNTLHKVEEKNGIDWILFLATIPLLGAGLITMSSFTGDGTFFNRQLLWIIVSITVFFGLSFIDFRFLRKTWVSVSLFLFSCVSLLTLFAIGKVTKGAISWFHVGFLSFQPADAIKLVVIIILAKYFSRRHIEIANIKHILVSGLYAFIIFVLVLIQPDFGTAIIIFLIWLGMVLVSGISKKHLIGMALIGIVIFAGLWGFGFHDYQKNRIKNFVNPLADIHGTGYNAYQSAIAVGSGQIFGKGVGYGVMIIMLLFGVVIWRIMRNAKLGASNFEMLFGSGVAMLIIIHFIINIGMNIQLLPVTGTTLPFMSYGGTHLLTEFTGLGILMGMRRYRRVVHKDVTKNEFIGPA